MILRKTSVIHTVRRTSTPTRIAFVCWSGTQK
jgi:hypothetical protein